MKPKVEQYGGDGIRVTVEGADPVIVYGEPGLDVSDLARSGYDPNTVKLLQMAISMCGMRAHGPEWRTNADGRSVALDRRRQVFLPFDLQSYARGDLAFTIEPRPIVYPTEQERIDIILQKESLQSRWGMTSAGIDETDADAILAERRDRFAVGVATGSFL